MNHFKLSRKTKRVLTILLVLILLVGCARTSVIDPETGEVLIDQVISLDTPWNYSELGFFTAVLIWPLAQVVNFLASHIGVVWAIIAITLIIYTLLMPLTIKSTVNQQKMQLMQPEQLAIQEKYKDRQDQQSQMRMSMEIQNLYKKHDVKMSAMFAPMLIQFPLIIAMWQALQRSAAVINGEFMGYSLAVTPRDGMAEGIAFYFIVFGIMIVAQAIGVLGPQWLNKQAQKNLPVYKRSNQNQNQGMMIFMLVFISFIGLSLVSALCIYLGTSSLVRFAQTAFIQYKYVNKEMT